MLRVNKSNPTQELISTFKLIEKDNLYSLTLDNKTIGYGIIREDKTNKIEIYILKQYQNNGYGSFLFLELLKKINMDIKLKTTIDNHKMKKIITKYHGKEISRNGEYIFYVITRENN